MKGETLLFEKDLTALCNRVTVKLKSGKNDVMLKVSNGNNPHGAYVTILSDQELKAGK